MKIALLVCCEEAVPPPKYGGTELVVANLAEELQNAGHDVRLFTSGDSTSPVPIEACTPQAIRLLPEAAHPELRRGLRYQALAEMLARMQNYDFDIIHNHVGWELFLFKHFVKAPIVTTLHGRLDIDFENYLYGVFAQMPYVSISNSQRDPLPELNYVDTIYHGIQASRFTYNANPKDYYAFLGRIAPDKEPDVVIRLAKKLGIKLKIGAKVDPVDRKFFETKVKPHIDGKQIVFLGEVDHQQKVNLLKDARALIAPAQVNEPFGLVTIEAMACGTPVITMNRGAMPEVVVNGKTGYVCHSATEMAKRVGDIGKISRAACRQHVEQHFTAKIMAANYITLFKKMLAQPKPATTALSVALPTPEAHIALPLV